MKIDLNYCFIPTVRLLLSIVPNNRKSLSLPRKISVVFHKGGMDEGGEVNINMSAGNKTTLYIVTMTACLLAAVVVVTKGRV